MGDYLFWFIEWTGKYIENNALYMIFLFSLLFEKCISNKALRLIFFCSAHQHRTWSWLVQLHPIISSHLHFDITPVRVFHVLDKLFETRVWKFYFNEIKWISKSKSEYQFVLRSDIYRVNSIVRVKWNNTGSSFFNVCVPWQWKKKSENFIHRLVFHNCWINQYPSRRLSVVQHCFSIRGLL